MTGATELFLGLGIIGAITTVIVSIGLVLARKEGQAASSTQGPALHEPLRRAS